MGVRGGIGLGVGGYSPPGNDVVVCSPEGLADMRLPWACKNQLTIIFFQNFSIIQLNLSTMAI